MAKIDKILKAAKATGYNESAFWLGRDFAKNVVDVAEMAKYKRSISNFVKILTKKDDIIVKFSTGTQSFTGGKTVVISAKLGEKEFDSAVGLTLHEASHCLLTDFKVFPDRFNLGHIPSTGNELEEWHLLNNIPMQYAAQRTRLFDILNIIEDRRIDQYVAENAPGYRGYYEAVYNKYFNSKEIDLALQEGIKKSETWDDYLFHICNFANKNRRVDALKELRVIWNMVDLANISRLKSTGEVLNLAFEIYKIIELAIDRNAPANPKPKDQDDSKEKESQKEKDEEENEEDENLDQGNGSDDGESDDEEGDSDENEEGSDGDEDSDSDEDEDGEASTEGEGDKEDKDSNADSKPARNSKLEKDIQAQKDFINQQIKKSKISKTDDKKIDAMTESNVSFTEVGTGRNLIDCVVIKGITKAIIDSDLVSSTYMKWASESYNKPILEGIALGTALGKKLKTRDEDRSLKTSRLDSGRIDKRLLHELGFNNERVFQQTSHMTSTPSMIHISIDASGSMGGSKWSSAMKTSVAIAKAASMISSLDCVISLRATLTANPLMWIVYDSRTDNFNNIVKTHFGKLRPSGSTPESLCFQAIQKDILNQAKGKDMYFINFSDGEPGYSCRSNKSYFNYSGTAAHEHCAKQVSEMRKNQIKVLSFFIGDGGYYGSKQSFTKMYGNDASFINIEDLNTLAVTLNKLFIRTNN